MKCYDREEKEEMKVRLGEKERARRRRRKKGYVVSPTKYSDPFLSYFDKENNRLSRELFETKVLFEQR